MNKNLVYACIALIAVGVIAVIYGLWPAPPPDTVFPVAKKQAEKRVGAAAIKVEAAAVKVADAKKKADSAATTVAPLASIANIADAKLTEAISIHAPIESQFAAAVEAAKACKAESSAQAAQIAALTAEIVEHEAYEAAQAEEVAALTDEVELFSARIDALEKENASLRRQQWMVKWGLIGIAIGVGGLWAAGII